MSIWQQVSARYNLLQLREKRLIFFGSALLLVWFSLVLFLEPAYLAWQTSKQQTHNLTRANEQLEQQLAVLQLQLAQDINQPLLLTIAEQQEQQRQMLNMLGAYQQQFITGTQTVKLLQDLLGQLAPLQLVVLRSEAATPIRLPGEPDDAPAQLFQHVTVLTVSGNYMQLKSLVQQLEGLPWLLSWQKLEYQVIEYPIAQMTLFIATVSADESYIQF